MAPDSDEDMFSRSPHAQALYAPMLAHEWSNPRDSPLLVHDAFLRSGFTGSASPDALADSPLLVHDAFLRSGFTGSASPDAFADGTSVLLGGPVAETLFIPDSAESHVEMVSSAVSVTSDALPRVSSWTPVTLTPLAPPAASVSPLTGSRPSVTTTTPNPVCPLCVLCLTSLFAAAYKYARANTLPLTHSKLPIPACLPAAD